jgi:cobalt-zinc-cadmium efflux system protein
MHDDAAHLHDHDHDDDVDVEHSHDHGSGDAPGRGVERALAAALALNGGFLVVEGAVRWWSGSLALLSDAAHMLSDVGALALAWGAARLATTVARRHLTFGFRRAEVVGAFVNSLTLIAACGWITFEAVGRLVAGPPDVAGGAVLVVATLGLLVNLGSAWFLHRSDPHNLGVRGALVHMLADALGSVGAMAAAVFLLYDVPIADPIVSLGIAGLILAGTWGLLRDSGRVLLQFPPPGSDVEAVERALAEVPGLVGVHHLHLWTLDGRSGILTAHLVLEDPDRWQEVQAAARRVLADDLGIPHVTLQMEPGGGCPEGPCCPALEALPAHPHAHAHAHG